MLGFGTGACEAAPEFVTQFFLARVLVRQIRANLFGRFGYPNDGRDVFGPGPAFTFMRAAKLDSIDRQTGAQIKKASSFGSVKFVRTETGGIAWQRNWTSGSSSLRRDSLPRVQVDAQISG